MNRISVYCLMIITTFTLQLAHAMLPQSHIVPPRPRMDPIVSTFKADTKDLWNRRQYQELLFLVAGSPALFRNSVEETSNLIRELITKGAQLDAYNEQGRQPIHLATIRNNNKAIIQFAAQGANINAQTEKSRYTPLHIAALNNEPDTVELLLGLGANPSITGKEHKTPIDLTSNNGIKKLIRDASFIRPEPARLTELSAMQMKKQLPKGSLQSLSTPDAIKEIIATVPHPEKLHAFLNTQRKNFMKNNFGEILVNAINEEITLPSFLEWLIKKMKETDSINNLIFYSKEVPGSEHHQLLYNITPLHIAAQRNNFLAARLLLDAGADPQTRDTQYKQPIDYATSPKMRDLLRPAICPITKK